MDLVLFSTAKNNMADELSLVLWSIAEYFNYTAVVLIILTSIVMTIFILRLNAEHWGHYHNRGRRLDGSFVRQKDVTAFTNPFFMTLVSPSLLSLSDGVSIEVSCLLPCTVHVYWGAAINPVHRALLNRGSDLVQRAHSSALLTDDCLAVDTHSIETAGKHKLHFVTPDNTSAENLGPPPRQRYPCVLVVSSLDNCQTDDYTNVVALVTIVHMKDRLCRMQTHIIAQYAKMAAHAVFNLQPLFFASLGDESDGAGNKQAEQLLTPSSSASTLSSSQMYSSPEVAGTCYNQPRCSRCSGNPNPGGPVRSPKNCTDGNCPVKSTNKNNGEVLKTANSADGQNSGGNNDSTEEMSSVPSTPDGVSGEHNVAVEEWLLLRQAAAPKTEGKTCSLCGEAIQSDTAVSSNSAEEAETLWSAQPQRQAYNNPELPRVPECIVCQSQRLNRVLLPCRHACVCGVCFRKLNRCPMCRCHIESYFTLSDESDDEGNAEMGDLDNAVPANLNERFLRLNRRLNAFFGFE